MEAAQFAVSVNSTEPEKLIAFYKDVVGLAPGPPVLPGAFMAGSSAFPAFIIGTTAKLREQRRSRSAYC